MLTTQVASYSILTIQLLVVCLTLVRWPTTDTAKALTSRQKGKPPGKKNNVTVRQKEKDSRQKEKPHGKISSIPRGHFNSYFFCREVMVVLFAVRLFFLPRSYSFCRDINSFAVTVVGHRNFKILFPKILIFQHVGIHEN